MSEAEEQTAFFRVCKLHEQKYPELQLIYHTPNGGKRNAAEAAKLKRMGVKPGVPDIFLPAPRGQSHGLFIELKAKGGSVTKHQREMMAALSKQGYACLVAVGWEEAWKETESYLQTAYVELGYYVEYTKP